MRTTLICTVGLSQYFSIRNRWKNPDAIAALEEQQWARLATLMHQSAYKQDEYGHQVLDTNVCGAEISSVESILRGEYVSDPLHLYLLVSDTDLGRQVGHLLCAYFSQSKKRAFKNVYPPIVLKGLSDRNSEEFKTDGLKDLVGKVCNIAEKHDSSTVVINATGGYKAQISFAGVIGQALDIPVFYQFEDFKDAIELPPQPVSLDLSLWLEHYSLFEAIESNQYIEKASFPADYDSPLLAPLLYEDIEDQPGFVELSAMGKLFHARCRFQFAKQEQVLLSRIRQDPGDSAKKKITINKHKGIALLKEFSKKLTQSPYVTAILGSTDHDSFRKLPIRNVSADATFEFVLTWTDTGYGVRVQTTGENFVQTNTIALHLADKYGNGR